MTTDLGALVAQSRAATTHVQAAVDALTVRLAKAQADVDQAVDLTLARVAVSTADLMALAAHTNRKGEHHHD